MANDSVELYEHPDYDAKKYDWQKWKDLYEGKHEVLVQPHYLKWTPFARPKIDA